jgi:hypothetical protein
VRFARPSRRISQTFAKLQTEPSEGRNNTTDKHVMMMMMMMMMMMRKETWPKCLHRRVGRKEKLVDIEEPHPSTATAILFQTICIRCIKQ